MQANTTVPKDQVLIEPPPEIPSGIIPPSEIPSEDLNEGNTFSDIRRFHYIGERIQEAVLHLRENARIYGELREFMTELIHDPLLKPKMREDCKPDFDRFVKTLVNMKRDLLSIESRAEALSQLLNNRRDLVSF